MKKQVIIKVLTLFSLFIFSGISVAQINSTFRAVETDPGFNRSVNEIKFDKDRNGRDILRMNIGLEVTDKSEKKINMNFDVNVYKNRKLIKKIKQSVEKGGAITCAVTCAGNCPSIFGDGICGGCSCSYDNWLSSSANSPNDGDLYEVKLVDARSGAKDKSSKDNMKRIVFIASPSRQ